MPSTLVGAHSGGIPMWSGNVFSGTYGPVAAIYLVNDNNSSGTVYVGYSGGLTITSGGHQSTNGLMDGVPIFVGSDYSVPKLLLRSGVPSIYLTVPTTISGWCRVFWDVG